jgi:large subunit ribosomal protein L3
MSGLIGKKVGMTQIFTEDGSAVPVTLVQAGPCVVVQKKGGEKDGYTAIQLGLVEKIAARRVTKARRGHFDKAGLPPCRVLREFRLAEGEEGPGVGDTVSADFFSADEFVDVTAKSKGRGFAGVMKRHGFAGGKATHGSMFHRRPGSIGQSAYPARVFKGMRGPGHMGDRRRTTKNLKVVRVDAENNLLFIKGAVPGAANGYVTIKHSRKG